MTQRSLRLVLLLLVLLPALVLAQTNQPGKLSVAEYNVEWMLDVYDDPYTKDEAMPSKPRKELEAIASAIRALNADVVALEEVENEGLLKVFTHDLLTDRGYQYIAVQPTNSDRGQNLGLLSRVPIISLTSHRFMDLKLDHSDKTWRFARDLLQVRLQVTPRHTLDLFIVHFKSKRDDEGDPQSAKWRLAEATAARKLLDEELKANSKAWVIITGDFNDTSDSPPVKALLTPGADGKPSLLDVHAGLPGEKRITYRKPPFREAGPIDYLLASPALAKRVVPGSLRVLDDESKLAGSDHAPITATFEVNDDGE